MNIPWKRWVTAFVEATPHDVRWVHRSTGEVRAFNPRRLRGKQRKRLESMLYEDHDWLEVPYEESDEAFFHMRQFAASTAAGGASRDLIMALGDPKPFRAFRVALQQHPDARKAWKEQRQHAAERRLWEFCQTWQLHSSHPTFQQLEAEAAREEEAASEAGTPGSEAANEAGTPGSTAADT